MTPQANSPSPSDLTAWDRDHNLHPWGGIGSWREDEYQRLNTGDGVYLWDSEGRKFIDGPGGMWCVQIGYGREEMADAIADQVRKMVYASPWSSTSEPAAILAHEIATVLMEPAQLILLPNQIGAIQRFLSKTQVIQQTPFIFWVLKKR
ncbi:MAG: aminotransferase class III-fold pyridoxal phosphate-dependent enzyme [Pseudomonadota bacterium]